MNSKSDAILFQEPFNRYTLDRLRFLFVYYDVVEVIDHSAAFAEFERDGWNFVYRPEIVRQEVEKACRKQGIRDRNEINRRYTQGLRLAQQAKVRTAPLLARAYAPHKAYWELLRTLDKAGYVHLVPAPLEGKLNPAVSLDEAESVAHSIASEFTDWIRDYADRTAAQYALDQPEAAAPIFGLITLILSRQLLTGLGHIVQGGEMYSGEDGLVRAISRLSLSPTPVHAKLGETVLNIEVPQIYVSEFDELAEVKQQLADLRKAFQVEMQALTADLGNREWNGELIKELGARKIARIDPVLFDLRRKLAEPLHRRGLTTVLDARDSAMGAAGIGLALAATAGAALNMQLLTGLITGGIGALTGAIAQTVKDRMTFDQNRLAYVVKLGQTVRSHR